MELVSRRAKSRVIRKVVRPILSVSFPVSTEKMISDLISNE
jgi:hypothetical protein